MFDSLRQPSYDSRVRIRCSAPLPVVLAGRAEEKRLAAPNVVDFLNRTTLPELCEVIRNARFVVSVDSGPMHIAAALNPRLLSIHTWSDPRKVGPYCPDAWVWKDGVLFQMSARAQPESHLSCTAISEAARWVKSRTNFQFAPNGPGDSAHSARPKTD